MMTNKSWYGFLFLLSIVFCLVAQAGSAFAKDHKAVAETIRTLNKEIADANERQDLPAAIRAAEGAVRVAQTEIGPQSLKTADAMNNLANLYLLADRAPEAEQIFKRAIVIDLDKLDKDGTAMADIYFNLGVAYAMQKKYREALDILNRALTIRLKKLGPDDDATKKTEAMMSELKSLLYPNAERI